MVMVERTEGNGSKVVHGDWKKIENKRKLKNKSQNKNNKNKNRNQDIGKEQTGLTSSIQTSPIYQGSRGRGKRGEINQHTNQHVKSTKI